MPAPRIVGGEPACPGFFDSYGRGCASAASSAPVTLQGRGCPKRATPIPLHAAGGPSGATAFLVGGAAHFTVPITPSCAIQVAEFHPLLLPVVFDAAGTASIDVLLPRSFPFAEVFVQLIVLDPAAPFGIAASQPLEINVGS
jgi:hypothetical protein